MGCIESKTYKERQEKKIEYDQRFQKQKNEMFEIYVEIENLQSIIINIDNNNIGEIINYIYENKRKVKMWDYRTLYDYIERHEYMDNFMESNEHFNKIKNEGMNGYIRNMKLPGNTERIFFGYYYQIKHFYTIIRCKNLSNKTIRNYITLIRILIGLSLNLNKKLGPIKPLRIKYIENDIFILTPKFLKMSFIMLCLNRQNKLNKDVNYIIMEYLDFKKIDMKNCCLELLKYNSIAYYYITQFEEKTKIMIEIIKKINDYRKLESETNYKYDQDLGRMIQFNNDFRLFEI